MNAVSVYGVELNRVAACMMQTTEDGCMTRKWPRITPKTQIFDRDARQSGPTIHFSGLGTLVQNLL